MKVCGHPTGASKKSQLFEVGQEGVNEMSGKQMASENKKPWQKPSGRLALTASVGSDQNEKSPAPESRPKVFKEIVTMTILLHT